jgi:hypothetical protein
MVTTGAVMDATSTISANTKKNLLDYLMNHGESSSIEYLANAKKCLQFGATAKTNNDELKKV